MQIIIMRHAEKPGLGNGLSETGMRRAALLPEGFLANEFLSEAGPPSALYAAAPKKAGSSLRSIQTLAPLAEHFNLPINQNYTKNNLQELAGDILSRHHHTDRTVVVCWSRQGISVLAGLLGAADPPAVWAAGIYNRLLIIRLEGNEASSLRELTLNLMAGDV